MEEVIAVLPFGGTFDLVQLKGSTLKKAFENSVRRYGSSRGEFLQVSGIHVEYDLSRSVGDRVTSLSLRCSRCRVPRYESLDPDRLYKLVLPSYIADGGDGFTMIKEEKLKHDTGDLDISVFANYIKEMKRVYPTVEGRIKFRNSSVAAGANCLTLLLLGLLWALSTSL